jgi:hypothetical protein
MEEEKKMTVRDVLARLTKLPLNWEFEVAVSKHFLFDGPFIVFLDHDAEKAIMCIAENELEIASNSE